MSSRRLVQGIFAGLLFMSSAGCHDMAVLWANMQGGDTIEAEYTFAKGPLLILIDDRNGRVSESKAIKELHETIATNFLQNNVNSRIVPFRDWQRLHQSEEKYDKMSVREIGEKLGADQVLWIGVDKFTLQSEPGAPLYKGLFTVRIKVLSTERKADVRQWPREEQGRLMSAETPPVSVDGDKSGADVATELGIKLGQKIAGLFYKHKEFAD